GGGPGAGVVPGSSARPGGGRGGDPRARSPTVRTPPQPPRPRAAGSRPHRLTAARARRHEPPPRAPADGGPRMAVQHRRPRGDPIRMTVHPVRLFGDPVLRTAADPVTSFDDRLARTVADLMDTVAHEEGAGLAAPQIELSTRAFVYSCGGREGHPVNPEWEPTGEETTQVNEGSPSTPGISRPTHRS